MYKCLSAQETVDQGERCLVVKVQDAAPSLHGQSLFAAVVRGGRLVRGGRALAQSVIQLPHRPESFRHVLRVPRLQFFVSGVVGVGKLGEVASHLRVADLKWGRVWLQIL